MAFVKAQLAIPQYEDVNGNPLAGGSINALIWDTSTPAAMYTDSAGSGSATSFTLNSLGQPMSAGGTAVDIFLDTSIVYKFILKDSIGGAIGAVIGPVYADYAVYNAGNLLITATGGDTPRTLSDHFGDELNGLDVGADNTGATDSSTVINALIVANTSIRLANGTYLLNSKLLLPYGGPNGNRKHIHFDNVELLAGSNSMIMLHWADSFCSASGRVRFNSNGKTGITPFSFSPELGALNTTVTNQNYNRIYAHIETIGADEGIEFMCGVPIGGTSSGCWYNVIYSYFSTSCKRAMWLRDNGSLDGANSGPNSQTIFAMVVNGSCNTGLQVDGGGGHQIHTIAMENVQLGTSPNATPVGIKVNQFMANGGRNANIKVYAAHWENVTQYVDANVGTIEFFGVDQEIEPSYGALVPLVDYYKSVKVKKGEIINSFYGIVTSAANIKGLWLFDQYGAVSTINDHSPYGHNVTLRDASLATQNASAWGPNIFGLAQGLSYIDQSHLFDTLDHADFNFGDGATDSAFSVIMMINPLLTASTEIFSKDDLHVPYRCFSFSLESSGALNVNLFDNSAGSYIGRTTPTGVVTASAWQFVAFTYDGSATNAGIKIYVGATAVDNADQSAGVYTAMENIPSKPGSYRINSSGTPERALRSKSAFLGVFKEALDATQIRRAYNLLIPFVGVSI